MIVTEQMTNAADDVLKRAGYVIHHKLVVERAILAALQKQWISVTDQLPTENGMLVVTNLGLANYEDGFFYSIDDEIREEIDRLDGIMVWQKLPSFWDGKYNAG
jgi:hypothetical protein